MDSTLKMFLSLCTRLSWINESAKEAPCVSAGHLPRGRVAPIHPVRVSELGRVLRRLPGEFGNSSFKFSVMFLPTPPAGEAVPSFPDVEEVVVHIRDHLSELNLSFRGAKL